MAKESYERTRELHDAKERLERIGEAQPHFRDYSVGKLHRVEVKTTIHHQRRSGDTNYHEDRAFDAALARVIVSRFSELSAAAIADMERVADEALIAEEQELTSRLELIREAKERRVAH
jgi:hypothetical protein